MDASVHCTARSFEVSVDPLCYVVLASDRAMVMRQWCEEDHGKSAALVLGVFADCDSAAVAFSALAYRCCCFVGGVVVCCCLQGCGWGWGAGGVIAFS